VFWLVKIRLAAGFSLFPEAIYCDSTQKKVCHMKYSGACRNGLGFLHKKMGDNANVCNDILAVFNKL